MPGRGTASGAHGRTWPCPGMANPGLTTKDPPERVFYATWAFPVVESGGRTGVSVDRPELRAPRGAARPSVPQDCS